MGACIFVAMAVRREGANTSPGHWWSRCAPPKDPDSGLSPRWGGCQEWRRKSGSDGERLHEFWMGNRDRHRALFEQEDGAPAWAEGNLRGVSIGRLRHLGEVSLGLALWKRLGLEEVCQTRRMVTDGTPVC